MLRGKIREDQKHWDLQLPACMMTYPGAVYESTGVSPNLLMLGRELEVRLDAITEAPPDAPPLKDDYDLSTSTADDNYPEDVSRQTVGLTVQVVPEAVSSVRGRPLRQRKPPSRYGAWVDG